eukprot:jgi/Hompol1/68/HPOL_003905-RA
MTLLPPVHLSAQPQTQALTTSEPLSASELRARLVETLNRTGVTDRLKMRFISDAHTTNGLAKITDVQSTDKEMQTNTDLEDILNIKIHDIERSMMQQRSESSKGGTRQIEDRLVQYQQQLELRMQADVREQIARFKELELAQMRIDERKAFQAELAKQKADFDQKMLDATEKFVAAQESEQARLAVKERDLERMNMDLRQKLLDENNKIVMKEVHLRNDAELLAKQVQMERDLLQRRFEDVQRQLAELQSFKEKYTHQMEESMAEYKIRLNKEHGEVLASVEIDRAKIEAERMVLNEKSIAVERMYAAAKSSEDERETLRQQLQIVRERLDQTIREKDDAVYQSKELQLQVEYQSLLKSLMTPKEDLREELGKSHNMEAKWQRECQLLVNKLDLELNRTEELQRRLDEEVLKNRELQRELADTRLLLHQAQSVTPQKPLPSNDLPPVPRVSVDMMPTPSAVLKQAPTTVSAPAATQATNETQKLPTVPLPSPPIPTATTAGTTAATEEDEAATLKRLQEERQRREEQRRKQELEDRMRIQQEKEQLAKQKEQEEAVKREKQRMEALARKQQEDQQRIESEKKAEEERQRQQSEAVKREKEEKEKQEAAKGDHLKDIENDPMMQKYMALVKERRENQAKAAGQPSTSAKAAAVPSFDSPPVRSAASSVSDVFGGTNTADDV